MLEVVGVKSSPYDMTSEGGQKGVSHKLYCVFNDPIAVGSQGSAAGRFVDVKRCTEAVALKVHGEIVARNGKSFFAELVEPVLAGKAQPVSAVIVVEAKQAAK